ncbi:glycoside-pentoside-hexuronide (GPH):cation symporter [Microbacterium gorillae]|uniref:glycoside-pentoside-hexuronide (GPH):cation symporter n=1 Tax=Microbacterium gorillae TaxID=1231063 RepID=UPI001E52560D|nr:glycoside-pentoside-hexuronide (GPH):cation symporter [Microbacterium gorillae]
MTANRVGFGIGAVGKDLVYALVTGFILYYYNSVLGVSGTFLGIIMMVARVFDAVDDPVMGVLVAKTRTRWGRFRPWILVGTVANAAMIVALFAVPPSVEGVGLLVWVSVFYMLWGATYTMMDIPFWSLIPAITQAGSAREKLVVVGRVGAALGGFLPAALTMLLVSRIGNGSREGFMAVAIGAAVIFVLAQLVTVGLVRDASERTDSVPEKSPTMREMLSALWRNDQALVVVVAIVISSIAMYLTGQLAVYFFQFDIGDSDVLTIFAVVGLTAQVAAMLAYPALRRRMSTRSILISGLGAMAGGYVTLFVLASAGLHESALLALGAAVLYVGSGLLSILTTVFLADTVDYGEWKTGRRDESVIFSLQTFVAKLGSAIAVLIAGIGLDVIGLDAEASAQSAGTLVGLRVLMFLVPIAFLVATAVVFLRRYRLDQARLVRIGEELRARAAASTGDSANAPR